MTKGNKQRQGNKVLFPPLRFDAVSFIMGHICERGLRYGIVWKEKNAGGNSG